MIRFTRDGKVPLYRKVYRTSKADGYFILTDCFASSYEEELRFRNELNRLKSQQSITDNAFYHYDTPLTVEHETQALLEADFRAVEVFIPCGQTNNAEVTMMAEKIYNNQG